jgi:hypothetical protein
LLLRNAFAADLQSLEGIPGILATGLAESRDLIELGETIARAVRQRASMRDALTAIRGMDIDRPFDALMTSRGTALFTVEPDLPIAAGGARDDRA